ncbi:hypothetical protein RUM43_001475 [Polyplax serrata]|uniref:Uncharacterized protein n=1 Tax=Polyplax serrata TaxID=468196 RepID=A0AAN8SFG1_POLSC
MFLIRLANQTFLNDLYVFKGHYFTLLKNKTHFDVALQDEQGKLSGKKKQLSPFIFTNYRPGLPNKARYEFFELGFFVWKLHRVPDTGPELWAPDK